MNCLTVLLPLLSCGPSFNMKDAGVEGVNPATSTTLPNTNAFLSGSQVVGMALTASGVVCDLPTHMPFLPVGWNLDCLCSGSMKRSPDWPKLKSLLPQS